MNLDCWLLSTLTATPCRASASVTRSEKKCARCFSTRSLTGTPKMSGRQSKRPPSIASSTSAAMAVLMGTPSLLNIEANIVFTRPRLDRSSSTSMSASSSPS